LTGGIAPSYDRDAAAERCVERGETLKEGEMPAQTGKRYVCPKCGSEVIVTRGGDGELMCGDTPLELKK